MKTMRPCHKNVHIYSTTRYTINTLNVCAQESRVFPIVLFCNHAGTTWLSLGNRHDHESRFCFYVRPLTPWCEAQVRNTPLTADECAKLVEIDYAQMRQQMAPIREELLRRMMCPANLHKARKLKLIN
jgi:hypothetical protein